MKKNSSKQMPKNTHWETCVIKSLIMSVSHIKKYKYIKYLWSSIKKNGILRNFSYPPRCTCTHDPSSGSLNQGTQSDRYQLLII